MPCAHAQNSLIGERATRRRNPRQNNGFNSLGYFSTQLLKPLLLKEFSWGKDILRIICGSMYVLASRKGPRWPRRYFLSPIRRFVQSELDVRRAFSGGPSRRVNLS
jgi:hypothetical protein